MKKLFLLLLLPGFFCSRLGAENTGYGEHMSYTIQFSFARYAGPAPIHNFGGGFGLMFPYSDKLSVNFNASLYGGGKLHFTDSARAFSSSTSPQTMPVGIRQKISSGCGELGLRYYLIGQNDYIGGVYGILGAGATLMRIKTVSVDAYDQALYAYQTVRNAGERDAATGLTGNVGIGGELPGFYFYFFGNVRYHFPLAANVPSSAGFPEFPSSISFEAGFRVPLED